MKSYLKLLACQILVVAQLIAGGAQVTEAKHNVLRDNALLLNAVTGQLERATLFEAYSRNVDSDGAAPTNLLFATGVANAALGPDGTTTAWRFVEDTTNVYHRWGLNPAALATANQPYTISFAAKAGDTSVSRTRIWVNTGATNDTGASVIDLTTGAVIVPGSGRTVRTLPLGSGWWWVVVTWSIASDPANEGRFASGPVSGATTTAYTGSTSASVLYWQVQCWGNRAIPSSPIIYPGNVIATLDPVDSAWTGPTETVNNGQGRVPDAGFELLPGTIASTPAAMSGFVEFVDLGNGVANNGIPANPGVWYLGRYDRTGARLWVSYGTTGYRISHNNGTSTVSSEVATAPGYGDLVRLRWTFAANGSVQIFQSINGRTETSGTASAALAPAANWGSTTRIWLGSTGAGWRVGNIGLRRCHVVSGTSTTLAQFIALN